MLKRDRIADQLSTLYLLKGHVRKEINYIIRRQFQLDDLTAVKEKLNDCKTATELINKKIDDVLEYCNRGVIYYSKDTSN